MGFTEKIRILLAEDDGDDCLLFKEVLEELSISTNLRIVSNGEQLMTILEKDVLPNVLFLDLNMPLKNGFICLDEIKANPRLEHLPVMIISTSSQQNTINLLYQKGAWHYIIKPNSFSRLKSLIHHALVMVSKHTLSATKREDFVLKDNTASEKTHA